MFGLKKIPIAKSDMNINIVVNSNDSAILQQLTKFNNKLNRLMANFQVLSDTVDALKASLTTEKQQVLDALGGLNNTITSLEAQLTEGATPAQIEELIGRLNAIKTDLEGTIPDAPAEEETPA